MKEFAIIKPPEENTEAEITRQQTDAKHAGHFQRRTQKKLLEHLNNVLQDAMVEIYKYPMIKGLDGGYRTQSYGEVKGGSYEGLSAWQMDLVKNYELWRYSLYCLSPVSLSICTRLCQDGEDMSSIRKAENLGQVTAYKLLQYGLNEYAITAGWGDQINERSR